MKPAQEETTAKHPATRSQAAKPSSHLVDGRLGGIPGAGQSVCSAGRARFDPPAISHRALDPPRHRPAYVPIQRSFGLSHTHQLLGWIRIEHVGGLAAHHEAHEEHEGELRGLCGRFGYSLSNRALGPLIATAPCHCSPASAHPAANLGGPSSTGLRERPRLAMARHLWSGRVARRPPACGVRRLFRCRKPSVSAISEPPTPSIWFRRRLLSW